MHLNNPFLISKTQNRRGNNIAYVLADRWDGGVRNRCVAAHNEENRNALLSNLNNSISI
jgi:hypothetical protein